MCACVWSVCRHHVQTCIALFSLSTQMFCKKPSRNKVTNRIMLKDVSYDSQTPFSNILFKNKWAPANIIELSEEIRLKMTERKRSEWE